MERNLLRPIRAFRRRMLLQQAADQLVQVLLAASLLLLVLLWSDKLFFVPWAWETFVGWFYGAGVLIVAGWAWLRRPGLLRAAVGLDQASGSRERLSTALALRMAYRSEPDDRWRPAEGAVWRDALSRAERLEGQRHFEWRLPKLWKAFGVVLAALALSAFAPEMDLLGRHREHQEALVEKATVRQQAARVERLVQRIEEQADEQDIKGVQEMTRKVANALQEMQHRPPDRREAIKRLSELERQVQAERQKSQAAIQALDRLEKNPLAKKIADDLKRGNLNAAAEKAKALQEKVQSGEVAPEDLSQLEKDLAAALRSARGGSDASSRTGTGAQQGEGTSEAGDLGELSASEMLGELGKNLPEMGEQALSAEQMDLILAQLGECKGCMGGGPGQQPGDPGVRLQRMCSLCGGKGCSACGGEGKQAGVPLLEEEGSTNLDQPGGPGRSWSRRALPAAEYVRLYDPRRTRLQPEDLRSRSVIGQGPILGTVDVESEPSREDVITPYEETFESFRSAAEEALDQEQVPLKYRPIVRRYFDTVDAAAEQEVHE